MFGFLFLYLFSVLLQLDARIFPCAYETHPYETHSHLIGGSLHPCHDMLSRISGFLYTKYSNGIKHVKSKIYLIK